MTPAGYQEAETVNQPLMAAQQINEAPEGLVELGKTHHTATFPTSKLPSLLQF